MELERAAASLRPRGPWEGLDLGFALARTWLVPLWLLWWTTALPVGLLLLPLTGLRADFWLLALWWLKPLFEGPLVLWTSRALFGERLGWRAFPGLLRAALTRRLWPYVLWRRLGLRRSFLMPMTLLEGLAGAAARDRRRVLSQRGGATIWLTVVCYHFEIALWAGILLGLYFLAPAQLPRLDLLTAVTDADSWAYWLSVLGYALAFSVIAPFYVCAGFALYLSRRTELEAWDLELAFKRARAPRTGGGAPRRGIGPPLALILLGSTLIPSSPLAAPPSMSPDQAQALIQEVLADSDFGRMEEVRIWVPIAGDESSDDTVSLPERLREMLLAFARGLKWLLLTLAVGAVALLAVRVLSDPRRGWSLGRLRPPDRPLHASLDTLRHEELPADVAARVRALLEQGDRRGALSLLYRASLAHLAQLGIDIPEGATEGECLELAASRLSADTAGQLKSLIGAWQGLAYARRVPSNAALGALLEAWSRWTAETAGPRFER